MNPANPILKPLKVEPKQEIPPVSVPKQETNVEYKPLDSNVEYPSVFNQKPISIPDISIPKPDQSTFEIHDGMTDGQKFVMDTLQKVTNMVNYNTENVPTDETMKGSLYFYDRTVGEGKGGTIEEVTERLFGKGTSDLREAYSMVMDSAKRMVSTDIIDHINTMSKEELKDRATQWLKDTGQIKEHHWWSRPEDPMESDYGIKTNPETGLIESYAIPKRTEATPEDIEAYKESQLLKNPKISMLMAGKKLDPEMMKLVIQAGVKIPGIVGSRKTKNYLLSRIGINGNITSEMTPQMQATLLHMQMAGKDDYLNSKKVFESKIMEMDDTEYASALQAMDALQFKYKEGSFRYLMKSSVGVFMNKMSNVVEYFKEGQGHDIFGVRNNAYYVSSEIDNVVGKESITENSKYDTMDLISGKVGPWKYAKNKLGFVPQSNGEVAFNPDGSVRTKYRKSMKELYWRLRRSPKSNKRLELDTEIMPRVGDMETVLPDSITEKQWLDYAAKDYYDVGIGIRKYERGVHSMENVLRKDYHGVHSALMKFTGNTIGTIVDMGSTAVIATIPDVGPFLAAGTLYASQQYEWETQSINAGISPEHARFWTSVFAIPYAMTEYMQVKALEPKVFRPVLEDIKLKPSQLHKGMLVGLGVETENGAFTMEERQLLDRAKRKWGFQNFLRVTRNETLEEYIQDGLEYGMWATLATQHPELIDMDDKEISMVKQMIDATIMMPIVTAVGFGMNKVAFNRSKYYNPVDELQKLKRDEALLYLANNSTIKQMDMENIDGNEAGHLLELPPELIKRIESTFSQPGVGKKINIVPFNEKEWTLEDRDKETTINSDIAINQLRSDIIKMGYSNPDAIIYNVRNLQEQRQELIDSLMEQYNVHMDKSIRSLLEEEDGTEFLFPVEFVGAEKLHKVLQDLGVAGNLDVVENPKEASEKYGVPMDEVLDARGFYNVDTGTIVLIKGNITSSEDATGAYIHEAVHNSNEFESRVANILRKSLGITENSTKEEIEETTQKARWILIDNFGVSEKQVSNMTSDQVFSELGAYTMEDEISENGTGNSVLLGKMVDELLNGQDTKNISKVETFLNLLAQSKLENGTYSFKEGFRNMQKSMVVSKLVEALNEELGNKTDEFSKSKERLDHIAKMLMEYYRIGSEINGKSMDEIMKMIKEAQNNGADDEAIYELIKENLIPLNIIQDGYINDLDGKTTGLINDMVDQIKEKMGVGDRLEAIGIILENLPKWLNSKRLEYTANIHEDILNGFMEYIANVAQQGNPKAGVRHVNSKRELAIRMAELRKEGKVDEAKALLDEESKNYPNDEYFNRDVETLLDATENVYNEYANDPKKKNISMRKAEIIASANIIYKEVQKELSTAKLKTIKVLDDHARLIQQRRILRQMARNVLSSRDVREFISEDFLVGLDKELTNLVENGAGNIAIQTRISELLEETINGNIPMIEEAIDRLEHITNLSEEMFVAPNGNILESEAGLAIVHELTNKIIQEYTKYHPSRARLIIDENKESWRAKSMDELLGYASRAITKVAYAPTDVQAQKAMKKLFSLAKPGARNLAWFERNLSGENLKKVLRWKKLHNMTAKKANEYIANKAEELYKLEHNDESSINDIAKALNELVEAQRFAGLKNKAPADYGNAFEYMESQLDEKRIAEAKQKLEEYTKKGDTLKNIVSKRKHRKLKFGLNTMQIFHIMEVVFGDSASSKAIIEELRTEVSNGMDRAIGFKNAMEESFKQKLEARTGLNRRQSTKKLRKLMSEDNRFRGVLLSDSEVVLTPSQAMNAMMSYYQNDIQNKAEATWDIPRIESMLTPFEKETMKCLQLVYEEEGRILAPYVKEKLGIEMNILSNYAPITIKSVGQSTFGKTIRPNTTPGFVLERINNSRELDTMVGALEVFVSHTSNGAVFYGMFDSMVSFKHIVLRPDVLEQVEKTYGKDARKTLMEFSVSTITQKTARNATLESESKLVDAMLSMQMLPLVYNLRSAFRQITSTPAFLLENDVSFGYVFGGLKQMFSSRYDHARKLLIESSTIQDRMNKAGFREMGEAVGSGESDIFLNGFQKFIEQGLKPNKLVDVFTIMGIAPVILQDEIDRLNAQGAYGGDQSKVEEMALAKILGIVNATQQSTQIPYRSISHLTHGGLRSIFQPFTSTLQQFASFEIKAYQKWRNADNPQEKTRALKELAKVFSLNHFILPSLYVIAGEVYNLLLFGLPSEDDPEEELNKFMSNLLINVLVGPMAGILFTGSIIKGAVEFGVRKSMDLPVYTTQILGSSINEMFDFGKIYRNSMEISEIAREAQWTDPGDIADLVLTSLEYPLPVVKQVEKIKERIDKR